MRSLLWIFLAALLATAFWNLGVACEVNSGPCGASRSAFFVAGLWAMFGANTGRRWLDAQ